MAWSMPVAMGRFYQISYFMTSSSDVCTSYHISSFVKIGKLIAIISNKVNDLLLTGLPECIPSSSFPSIPTLSLEKSPKAPDSSDILISTSSDVLSCQASLPRMISSLEFHPYLYRAFATKKRCSHNHQWTRPFHISTSFYGGWSLPRHTSERNPPPAYIKGRCLQQLHIWLSRPLA